MDASMKSEVQDAMVGPARMSSPKKCRGWAAEVCESRFVAWIEELWEAIEPAIALRIEKLKKLICKLSAEHDNIFWNIDVRIIRKFSLGMFAFVILVVPVTGSCIFDENSICEVHIVQQSDCW